MSLLTPPNTGHREKENRIPALSAHRVNWSPHNQYRTIAATPSVPFSASKSHPTRSILRKTSEPLLPLVDVFQRETTPEPSRPQSDPAYLSSSVATILDASSLNDLIRAYSILAARIRAHITLESDASCLLLLPLRKNRTALADAIVRDLARGFVDPESMEQSPEDLEEEQCLKEQPVVLLPSPKSSPKKKKKGTTAQKAKYGRDLCAVCHSVLKLLGAVFTLPAVYNVFAVPELRLILTEVLAIPLADELPTPNARKTYALSIWLLQTQRLPPAVLEGAADRIVFAIRRGIEGELGKEGKKGSASDGLKAIHDLSVYQPSIFVPRFEALLPSVLANLLATTLGIRAQACHALGGLARGLTMLPVSSLHTRISAAVVAHLTTPSTSTKSPSKTPSNESTLVRTLRTTLTATEVQHVAQGPVWALSVVAALLVVVNSAVYADALARRVFIALLSCAMNHRKSSVRALASAVWRSATWAYCQPLLPSTGDEESEVDEEKESYSAKSSKIEEGREAFWTQIVVTVIDMGAGTSTIAALLEEPENTIEDNLAHATAVLKVMISKGGVNFQVALEILARMVSFEPTDSEWNWSKLLPRGLFSASPGLLTADYSSLENPVRSVIDQCPDVEDVRSLTRDEVAQPAIFDKLVEIWKECIGGLGLQENDPIPPNILTVWEHLVQASIDDEASNDAIDFASVAVDLLLDILMDHNIDVTLKHGDVRQSVDGVEPTNNLSNAALKIKLIRPLWAITRKLVLTSRLAVVGQTLIFRLMKSEDEFTDSGETSRVEWANLCAEVLAICEPEDLQEFWNYDGAAISTWEWTAAIRRTVWRCFVEKAREEDKYALQAVMILLAIPFTSGKSWQFKDSDYELWESFLGYGIDKALDYGFEGVAVLDHVADCIAKEYDPSSTTLSRVVDILLSQLPMEDIRELPESFFDLVNETLRSTYPPEPRNKQQALWTLRSLVRTIENCPLEHILDLLRLVEQSVCIWLTDEYRALTEPEYAYDAATLFEVILMKIRSLPAQVSILQSVGSILESAFMRRDNIPAAITDAFAEFWDATYSTLPTPRHGWPAEIQTCLGDKVGGPWDKMSLSPAFRGPQVVSPDGKAVPIGSPFKLRDARFRSVSPEPEEEIGASTTQKATSVVQSCRPTTPTTLVNVPARASTPPPRPHKVPSAQPSPTSPASPIRAPYPRSAPSTPKRTPLRVVSGGSSRPSPSKRRRLDGNKENESPRVVIASVMDRINAASPRVAQELAAVSKKPTSPDCGEEERPLKRSRQVAVLPGGDGPLPSFLPNHKDCNADKEEEEERLVAFSLVEREASTPEKLDPPSKKRKRMVLDAVEVRTVREVYSTSSPTKPKLAETQSRTTSAAARRNPDPSQESTPLSRKRRRDNDETSDDPFIVDAFKGRPSPSKMPSSELSSSDDDIYLGQVTPYHVVSPALRRAREDDPPSSDDSNMSASPLKGVVLRRLQKRGSNGRLPATALVT